MTDTSFLSSRKAVPIYIPKSKMWEWQFPHILGNIRYCQFFYFTVANILDENSDTAITYAFLCLWAISKPFLYAYCILYVLSDCSLCSFYHLGYYRCFLGDKLKWKTCCSPLKFFFLPICILKLISKELKHCYLYKIWTVKTHLELKVGL